MQDYTVHTLQNTLVLYFNESELCSFEHTVYIVLLSHNF